MRTTLTLDKDIAAMVERLRKSRRQTMEALINDALRQGLKSLTAPNRARKDFETESVDLGRCSKCGRHGWIIACGESESFR